MIGITRTRRWVLADHLEAIASRIRHGCSDGHCKIDKPMGMHTNGGCRCNRTPVELLEVAAELEAAFKNGSP